MNVPAVAAFLGRVYKILGHYFGGDCWKYLLYIKADDVCTHVCMSLVGFVWNI